MKNLEEYFDKSEIQLILDSLSYYAYYYEKGGAKHRDKCVKAHLLFKKIKATNT